MTTAFLRRAAVFVALGATAVLAFSSLGGVGFARTAAGAAQYEYGQYGGGHKVTICHKGKVTITISRSALPAHLRHGDGQGTCAQVKAKKAKAAKAKAAKAKAKAAKAKAAKAKAAKAKAAKAKAKAAKAKAKAAKAKAAKAKAAKAKAKGKGKAKAAKAKAQGSNGKAKGKGKG